MDMNWLSPKAEARPAGDKGMGSFVVTPISAGETVVGFGGWCVPRAVLDQQTEDQQSRSIQVADDLYLMPSTTREPGDFVNHSCAPNLGLVGSMVLVAMRDIEVGEELTFDYATCDDSDYDEFECCCGSTSCRGKVTGRDWQRPELQQRYAGWFSPYIARLIANRK